MLFTILKSYFLLMITITMLTTSSTTFNDHLDPPKQLVPLAAVSQHPSAVSEIIKYTSHNYSLLFHNRPYLLTFPVHGYLCTINSILFSIKKPTVYWVQYTKPKNMLNIKRIIWVDQMMNAHKLYLEGQNICKVCAVVLLPAPAWHYTANFWHFKKK